MGYATAYALCGCTHTMIMESGMMIRYVRCVDHYVAAVDDSKVAEAANNNREHEQKIMKLMTHGIKE